MGTHVVSRWTVLVLAVFSLGAAARDVPLVEAVKGGSAGSVRALLDQRADVNVAEADGTTALHWAVQAEAAALVGLLIDAGADVKAANRYGVTPLSLACVTGNAGIIGHLLEAGADANAATAGGRTALMTAARTGDVAAVTVLLAHGADVHATDDTHGQTALMWAAAKNNAGVVDTLVRAGADVGTRTKRGFTAFLFAARAGRIEAATALLAAGADVNEALPNSVTPLLLAITNKNYELAADLLRAGADPDPAPRRMNSENLFGGSPRDAVGWSALHRLASSRQTPLGFHNPERVHRDDVHALDLARQLLALGADPNARIAKELKDRRAPRGGTGATPFFVAARAGDVELMRVLVEYGADPFLPIENNTTPLMAAAGVGVGAGSDPGTNEEVTEAFTFVLELGGNIHTVNAKGETALHGAASRGANPIVQMLVERGACLDATNNDGWTPLARAGGFGGGIVFKQQPETVALLRQLMESRTPTSPDRPRCGGMGPVGDGGWRPTPNQPSYKLDPTTQVPPKLDPLRPVVDGN